MIPDTSRWRDERAYDHFDMLPVSALAWECLRRNRDYQNDFASSLERKGDLRRVHQRMMRRWGLRFSGTTKPGLGSARCFLESSML